MDKFKFFSMILSNSVYTEFGYDIVKFYLHWIWFSKNQIQVKRMYGLLLIELGSTSTEFSKKIENHCHAISLHYMYYNFARIHKTLRVTPAMEAGISDHVWEMEEIAELTGWSFHKASWALVTIVEFLSRTDSPENAHMSVKFKSKPVILPDANGVHAIAIC